jgi:hypothetical protein
MREAVGLQPDIAIQDNNLVDCADDATVAELDSKTNTRAASTARGEEPSPSAVTASRVSPFVNSKNKKIRAHIEM